jgi:hypothetical protein
VLLFVTPAPPAQTPTPNCADRHSAAAYIACHTDGSAYYRNLLANRVVPLSTQTLLPLPFVPPVAQPSPTPLAIARIEGAFAFIGGDTLQIPPDERIRALTSALQVGAP